MSEMMTTVEKWEDRVFDQVKHIEEPMLRLTRETSDALARFVPERPKFMADMPMMTEVVESQLKFRKRLMDEQTRFIRKMIKAMDPVMTKVDPEPKRPVKKHTEPVAKMAPKRTSRKAA